MPINRQKKARAGRAKAEPKAYHHGDLKAALIGAAVKMLRNTTPENLSMRELAREAGVSQAAPYRHFPDKEALLAAISQEGFDLKYRYMREAIDANRDKPLEMFFACALAYFKMGLLHPQHFNLMVSSGVIPSEKHPCLLMAAKNTFVLVRDMVVICQRAGLIGPGDPYHHALNCWSMVNGFTALYTEGRLAWVGVTKENAGQALKTLVSQYLIGAGQPLEKSNFGFSAFANEESRPYKAMMDEIKLPD